MATLAELSIKADTSQVVKADQDLQKLGNTAQTTEKKTDGFTAGAGKATKASSGFSNGARNLSLQLSQVAQQGSVTGNYFQALAIQLPDIMLSFGTLGILVGAAAGVLGTVLVDALSGSSKETKELDKNINELMDSLESSEREANESILARLKLQAIEAEDEIRKLQNTTDGLSGRALRAASAGEEIRANRIKEITEEILELEGRSATTGRARNAIAANRRRLQSELAELQAVETSRSEKAAEIEGRRQKILEAIEVVQGRLNDKQSSGIDNSAETLKNLEAAEEQIMRASLSRNDSAVQAASNRNSMLAQAYSDDLISFERYKELKTQNQQNLQDDLSQIEEQGMRQRQQILTDGQQAALGAAGALFGNLAAIAKEGGKKQFDEYKALASAQAAISAALAISQALAAVPPPLNIVLASSIGALTAVQIAKINQQEYTGARALGGQVQGGNKYLVGENGPEVVTMGANGYVTPNSQLGGGTQVTQVFNFSAGVTRAELAGVLPQVAEAAKQATLAALSKGGSASQAVRRRA